MSGAEFDPDWLGAPPAPKPYLKSARDEADKYQFDVNPEDIAKERGLIVVYPLSNQLQIDIDSEEQYIEFKRRFDHLSSYWDISHVKEVPSASGMPKRHVYINFRYRTFTDCERLVLQAALNDDPIRVFLNALRLENNEDLPSRMFEKPETLELL